MKTTRYTAVAGIVLIAMIATAVYAALDASIMQNAVILAPQGTSPTRTETAIVDASSYTTNWNVESVVFTNAGFYGDAQLVAAFDGNAEAAYTNGLFLLTGTNATLAGDVTTQQLTEVTADAISIYTTEIDMDAMAGTHWRLRFTGETDNVATSRFAAKLIHAAVPTAAQTVTSASYDRLRLKGVANIIVSVGVPAKAAADFSGTVQMQHGTTSTGAWSNVSGSTATVTGAAGGIATIPLDTTGGNRYLRAVYTTTNDTADVSVTINSFR